MKRILLVVSALLVSLGLTACLRSLPTVPQRLQAAEQIASKDAQLSYCEYPDDVLPISGWTTGLAPAVTKHVHVYIEGDGLAWVTARRISSNPTPVNPVALKLAVADPFEDKVYLGRPGQYQADGSCDARYWTSHRFSAEVVVRYQEVLNQLKKHYAIGTFTLIGFSGGGTLAALIAAGRDDVTLLVTVAGNLDIAFWTDIHQLTPLWGSLNPAEFSLQLQNLPQVHFVGGRDDIVGLCVLDSYRSRFDHPSSFRVRLFERFDHQCCWERVWADEIVKIDPDDAQ